jgi:ADP-heptose:LPS heptosyltransferase
MIEDIRKNIGIFLARLQGLRRRHEQMNFTGVYSHARSALFIAPNEEGHRSLVLDVLRKAQQQFQGNALTIVTTGSSGKLSGRLKQCTMVPVGDEQVNFFFLPNKNLLRQLRERRYDVIVDLNLSVTPLAASICAAIESPLKAGFSSPRSDALYNLQLQSALERDPKARYEQLLRTLAMF